MSPRQTVPFRGPTEKQIATLADSLGLSLTTEEVEDYTSLVSDAVAGISGIRGAETFERALRPDSLDGRDGGYRPDEAEDPHNAWVLKTTIEPHDDGPLGGVTVGLKDSIALAGYELTAGSIVLEGFVPQIDAPVVTRLREHGATIVGKLNMESFAWSGTGDLSDFGPVLNPHDIERLAGGSSSGSGAAPANGECDVALGTDQAGSIRIPSSWCGLVGLKPTYGLVPYTGILPLEHSIDHVGPMSTSVELVAQTLSAIAGELTVDRVPFDDRQPREIEADSYTEALGRPIDDLSIGVVEEGFGWDASEPAVDDAVRDAMDRFRDHVGRIESVSVPIHRDAVTIWGPIATSGGVRNFLDSGVGLNNRSWSWPGLAGALDAYRPARTDDLPPSVKRTMLAAAFLETEYGSEAYAKARGAAMAARRAYDHLLEDYDALVMPTTVVRAMPLDPEIGRVEALRREVATILNTCLFNVTGHPAVTVPGAGRDGLPVGTMFVGSHFEEATLLATADGFERTA